MQEYGCSLSELVSRRRLNVAASLLDSTELSVAEIAASVGYLQESHFYARFRKLYGIPPLAFREESRKKRR
jgi:transcriptional regulator GlxA family with amidase domain